MKRRAPASEVKKRIAVSSKTVSKHAAKPEARAIRHDPEKLAEFIKQEQAKDNRLKQTDVGRQAKDAFAVYKAQKAKIELDLLQGKVVMMDAVRQSNAAAMAVMQTDIMAQGELLAPVLYGKDMVSIKEELDKHGRRLLTAWSKIPRRDGG